MNTRRRFLAAGMAGGWFSQAGWAAGRTEVRFSEIETRIARGDFRDIYKEDLGTPAMILDQAIFEQNLRTMAEHSRTTGINIRPHVKIHKCQEITKRQIALGAVGACCATIAESEFISNAGVRGVLWTCQPAGKNKISRAVALSKKDPTFQVVVDDPLTADLLEQAAEAARARLNVFVDNYVGLTRQGIQPGEPALNLAQMVAGSKHMRLAGLMGYSGHASHTKNWEQRRKRSQEDLAPLLETAALCRKAGLAVDILTGGSTGTYNIDKANGLTELQCGSYIFMDTIYRAIGGKSDDKVYTDFGPALTVMSTVVSKTRPNQCAIDAGNKAMLRPTDEVKGRPEVKIENQGAEYGMLLWNNGDRDIKLGERVEIYPSNLDMSVNVYDRVYVAKGEQIVDVWPIMGRSGPPQR